MGQHLHGRVARINRSKHSLKHFAYSAGWKKFEPAWDFVIRLKQLSQMRPMLEAVLSPVGRPLESASGNADLVQGGKRADFVASAALITGEVSASRRRSGFRRRRAARRLEATEGRGNAAFVDAQARVDPASGAIWTTVGGTR